MSFSLSLIEILALAGLLQCVSILVYLFFRAGSFKLAFVPILFFLNLTAALYLDFASSFFVVADQSLFIFRFWVWMFLCPLSILFILQFSDLSKPLSKMNFCAFLPLSAAMCFYYYMKQDYIESYYVLGAIGATLSLPFLWLKQNVFEGIKKEESGHERYWMILALIGLTIILISLVYAVLSDSVTIVQYAPIRSLIGLLFVYLSATYLFRIYPAPIRSLTKSRDESDLNKQEEEYLKQINQKLEYEKVYLEASYSRSDMAQELKIPEGTISKLMKYHYGRNFPMVLNDFRVEEACQLLSQTQAPIKVIAEEVGFNSLASFNRVFKEKMAVTASAYKQKELKEASRKIG